MRPFDERDPGASRAFTVYGIAPSEVATAFARVPGGLKEFGLQIRRAREGSIVIVSRDRLVPDEPGGMGDWLESTFGGERVAEGKKDLGALVVDELSNRGYRLAAAESCTGGMLGARITSVVGSSSVFWGSVVSYADEAKRTVLAVSEDALRRHGAVSEAVVREMAEGVRQLSGAHVTVAISGVAGPGGGTKEKPVGTVWIACADRGAMVTRRFRFAGSRSRVRRDAVIESLLLIRSRLLSG